MAGDADLGLSVGGYGGGGARGGGGGEMRLHYSRKQVDQRVLYLAAGIEP